MQRQLFIGVFLLAIPATALAQGGPTGSSPTGEITQPTLPANPQSPADFQGAARPPAAPATTPGAPAGKPAQVDGYSGGDLIITDTPKAMYGARGQKKIPEFHDVVKGDSMWGLCDFYYGDPWAWPQLWAYNKTITNPHWIYPGDKIRMLAGTSKMQRKDLDPFKAPVVEREPPRQFVRLKQRAFVEKRELDKSTKIIGSPAEKWMLTRFDEMYLENNKKTKLKLRLGRTYSVYRVEKKLYNMKGRLIGYLVLILGTTRVKRLEKDKAALAVVKEAYNSIERGDRVGYLRRLYRTAKPRPATRNVEARIIANLHDTRTVGTDTVVFLDVGKAQGVRPGNRLLVVRRGDGFKTILEDSFDDDEINKRFPDETTAEILVLDVHEEASVGFVTRARKEVRNGDFARMRRGY